MAWVILVVANVVVVLIATFVGFLAVVGAQFGLNDGPPGRKPVPLSWLVALQGVAIPVAATVVFFLPAIALLKHDMPTWAFGLTSVPYIFLFVTSPVWWRPFILVLG